MTIADVSAFQPEVAVIPIGSTEPHGPHLPYGTDTLIAGRVTEQAVLRANAGGARVVRLPTLPFGNNVNFKSFPFACRIRVETLMAVLSDQVAFLSEEGIRKILFVNGHGGNDATVSASLRQIFDRFQQTVFVCASGPCDFAAQTHKTLFHDHSPHAGDFETSLIMHIAPGLVVTEALAPAPMKDPIVSGLGKGGPAWVRPWHQLMEKSCGGRPDHATPAKGKEIFDASVAGMAEFLIGLSKEPWHPGFPYAN